MLSPKPGESDRNAAVSDIERRVLELYKGPRKLLEPYLKASRRKLLEMISS
jgi:hypothetical protein